ncbi:hypothetical protein G0S15_002994 [Salmonella enterica]|nr:hypothetical protein [Salmonella enterica]
MVIVFWVSVAIAVLSVICGIAGLVNPSGLKDNKTGEIPKRSETLKIFGGLFIVSAVIAFVSRPDKNSDIKTVVTPEPTIQTKVEATPPVKHNEPEMASSPAKKTPASSEPQKNVAVTSTPPSAKTPKKALTLDEAKSLAEGFNDFMEKMERLTIAGLETDDFRGIKKYVSTPLKTARYHFDDSFVGGIKPEPIALFMACGDAAIHLQDYVDDILTLQPGVYKAQRLESDLNKYYSNKENCGSLVNESDQKTNSRWKARMKEYKKLVDSLGGEDCFTVYTVDGTAPKPAHCKK